MTSLFDDYEQQYAVLTAEITANIGQLRIQNNANQKDLQTKISSHLDEAVELLEQMGLEIRDAEPGARPSLHSRLNCYQAELKRLQQEFSNAKNGKKSNGYDSVDDDFEEIGIREEQQRRLLDNSERIERTGRQLEDGYRIVVETEQLGTQVLQDLHQQRETIGRSRARLRDTDAELGRSGRVLTSMVIRSLRERFVLVGIIGLFILVVSLSMYFHFRN